MATQTTRTIEKKLATRTYLSHPRRRQVYHYLKDRVCERFFLCMLAYYVEWHMKEAWREVLFSDEDRGAKKTYDAVAPTKRSTKALERVHSNRLDDGTRVHSFHTLLMDLATIVRNSCAVREEHHTSQGSP